MMSEQDIRMMNPLKLAFLGDAIFEAYVRVYIVSRFVLTPNEMSKKATEYVRASAQSYIVHTLKPFLTEFEWDLVKRGRNQKSGSVPKNANLTDYKYATGFEALVGYLYLTQQKDRIYELVAMAIQAIDRKEIEKGVIENET